LGNRALIGEMELQPITASQTTSGGLVVR